MLYIPKLLGESIWSLPAGRTQLYYCNTYFCHTHQKEIDKHHLTECSCVDFDPKIKVNINLSINVNLRD
jgi:hypothetical protein